MPRDVCWPLCTTLPNMCLQASPGLCVWLFHDLYRVRRQTVFFSLLLHVCELTAAEPCACGSFSCSEIDNFMQRLLLFLF